MNLNLMTQPVNKQSHPPGKNRSAQQWLDALSLGDCDQETFFRGVADLLPGSPDAGWDLLALVDQYYRRGKISAETFGALKAHLSGVLLGNGWAEDVSIPVLRMQGEPPPPIASPTRPVSIPPRRGTPLPVADMNVVAPAAAANLSARLTPIPAAREPAGKGSNESQRSLAAGDLLRGRYRIQGVLGQGGMGTVFAAIDEYRLDQPHVDQRVAIKVLHTAVIKRPRLFAELRREFQHLQSLSHPNIVRVHDFDRDGDLAFFSMEYLDGAMLSRVLAARESSGLYRPYALAIIRDVGAAVAHAHAHGVVHGDLNPGNIFITDAGEVRVLDFGASHQLHHGPWISEFDDAHQVAVATPMYASCQLLEGEVADARDDVYALACIAYALLTGDHPYRDHNALKARTARLTPIRPKGLGRRHWHALRAGLNFDRERRPSNLRAWLERFDFHAAAAHLPTLPSLLTLRPHRHRSARQWATLAAGIALIVACAGWVATHGDTLAEEGIAVTAKLQSMFAPDPNPNASPPQPISEPSRVEPANDKHQPTNTPVPAEAEPARVQQAAPATTSAVVRPSTVTPAVITSPAMAPATATPAPGQPVPQRARVELVADNVNVSPEDPMARVVVHRSRNLRGDASFSWWTESGTAKPGRDFETVKTRVERIENGKNAISLLISIVGDKARHEARSFYVVIDQSGDNTSVGPRTLTMVTIPGTD